ncbi:MAG: ribosomal-protein-alanine N-acetyltransferase [Clostridia bacterium]|nr:ribosomal-protein-alanine N-acetyltransferase [Clostridia bacterium]NCC77103.1 ribosomal-protein-alanine N-acetyltransferase [Clostridia bacterium]
MKAAASNSLHDACHQTDWLVRPARLDDLSSLVRLEQTCFAIPWTEQSLRSDLENPSLARYFVAESKTSGVIGYIACYQAADTAQITNLAVLPDFRRQGVGELLLGTLLEWAHASQVATVDLEVRSSNESAIRLYQKMGFAKVGVRRAYYSDNNENANIMLKNIT